MLLSVINDQRPQGQKRFRIQYRAVVKSMPPENNTTAPLFMRRFYPIRWRMPMDYVGSKTEAKIREGLKKSFVYIAAIKMYCVASYYVVK